MKCSFRMLFTLLLPLQLAACAPSAPKGSVDWDNINYADIVCGKDNAARPECKAKDEDVMSTGRGKGK